MNTSCETQIRRTFQKPEKSVDELNQIRKQDTSKLVSMIKANSQYGFQLLYKQYSGALFHVILKAVWRKEIAEELLQDVFVKIWKNIEAFDPEKGTLFTWMLYITRNHAIDFLRSSAHNNRLMECTGEEFEFYQDKIGDAQSSLMEFEISDFRTKALQMEARYTEVIDMLIFSGWTHQQTAEKLNLPLGTVKTRARKGLKLLKEIFYK